MVGVNAVSVNFIDEKTRVQGGPALGVANRPARLNDQNLVVNSANGNHFALPRIDFQRREHDALRFGQRVEIGAEHLLVVQPLEQEGLPRSQDTGELAGQRVGALAKPCLPPITGGVAIHALEMHDVVSPPRPQEIALRLEGQRPGVPHVVEPASRKRYGLRPLRGLETPLTVGDTLFERCDLGCPIHKHCMGGRIVKILGKLGDDEFRDGLHPPVHLLLELLLVIKVVAYTGINGIVSVVDGHLDPALDNLEGVAKLTLREKLAPLRQYLHLIFKIGIGYRFRRRCIIEGNLGHNDVALA